MLICLTQSCTETFALTTRNRGPKRDLWNPQNHDFLKSIHDSTQDVVMKRYHFSPLISYPYPSHRQVVYFFCRCVSDLTRPNLGSFFRT